VLLKAFIVTFFLLFISMIVSLIHILIVLRGFLDVPFVFLDFVLVWALRTQVSYLSAAIACFIFAALRERRVF
jgi:hypothetical protein